MSGSSTGGGLDPVGLPIGSSSASGSPDAFDFGDLFNKVKKFVIDNDDKIVQVVVPWLKKKIQSAASLSAEAAGALDLPGATPITKMIAPSLVQRLSPAVARLTKDDLIALGGWGVTRKLPHDLGLSPRDIQTIRDVFTPQLTKAAAFEDEPEAFSLSCCSCTPCCCAAAVMQPIRMVA